jgi:putative acyl-CoA dehydrogenase
VIALDVLRAMAKEPDALENVLTEIRLAADPRIEKFVTGIHADVSEHEGRRVAERLALALQASLLVRFSPPAIADAFCRSRLEGYWGHAFGTLPRGVDLDSILRATWS